MRIITCKVGFTSLTCERKMIEKNPTKNGKLKRQTTKNQDDRCSVPCNPPWHNFEEKNPVKIAAWHENPSEPAQKSANITYSIVSSFKCDCYLNLVKAPLGSEIFFCQKKKKEFWLSPFSSPYAGNVENVEGNCRCKISQNEK